MFTAALPPADLKKLKAQQRKAAKRAEQEKQEKLQQERLEKQQQQQQQQQQQPHQKRPHNQQEKEPDAPPVDDLLPQKLARVNLLSVSFYYSSSLIHFNWKKKTNFDKFFTFKLTNLEL